MSLQNAFLGSLVGDAISMPVHWYYDRNALDRDYGDFDDYLAPKNPHPDSILWRSNYQPINSKADILHEQKKYWGTRGVHYHQFLQAGENDLDNLHGNWPLANRQMEAALKFSGYDYKFVMGDGAHNGNHGGTLFPDMLRWMWRDYKKEK